MNNRKKLFIYLLLNIIISALTVLCVLFIWDRAHSPKDLSQVPESQALPNISASPKQTDQDKVEPNYEFDENAQISIEGIFGIGQSDIEHVSIRNIGDVVVNLHHCKLINGLGDEYSFPEISLNPEGAVNIFTKTGNDTVLELFWGRSESLWHSGDLATLLDQNGNVHSTYQIP